MGRHAAPVFEEAPAPEQGNFQMPRGEDPYAQTNESFDASNWQAGRHTPRTTALAVQSTAGPLSVRDGVVHSPSGQQIDLAAALASDEHEADRMRTHRLMKSRREAAFTSTGTPVLSADEWAQKFRSAAGKGMSTGGSSEEVQIPEQRGHYHRGAEQGAPLPRDHRLGGMAVRVGTRLHRGQRVGVTRPQPALPINTSRQHAGQVRSPYRRENHLG